MRTVRQLLESKSRNIYTVTPTTTVYDSLILMAQKEIGAVLVLDQGRLVGILSERDYARKIIIKGKASKDTLAYEIMSPPDLIVQPQHTIQECMALMTERRARHLPVFDEDRLIGLISIGDVVKDIIDEQEFVIKQLETYITS